MNHPSTAALRAERRRIVREARRRRREERMERALGIIAIILALVAYAFCGTLDYQDRMADLSGDHSAQGGLPW